MFVRPGFRSARVVLAALAIAAAAGPARAACTNPLTNPGFDLGTTGWNTAASGAGVDVYLVASPDDRQGDPGESAGLVTNDSTGAGADVGTFPLEADLCAGIAAGTEVQVAGWIWIPTLQSTTGHASIALRWSGLAHCDGALGYAETTVVSTPGGWTFVDDVVTAPPGVDSFKVGLSVTKNQAGGSFVATFDDLSVCVPEPASPLSAGIAVGMLAACRAQAGRLRGRHASRAPSPTQV